MDITVGATGSGNNGTGDTAVVSNIGVLSAGGTVLAFVTLQDTAKFVTAIIDDSPGGVMSWAKVAALNVTGARIEVWATPIGGGKAGASFVRGNLSEFTEASITVVEALDAVAFGINVSASGSGANPSIGLLTQDNNNVVIAAVASVGSGAASALTGTLHRTTVSTGSNPVRCSSLSNLAATPTTVIEALTLGATTWGALAVELRTSAVVHGGVSGGPIWFCTTTAELQDALDGCQASDTIRLDHTKIFTGNFLVRNRGAIPDAQRIVIESDTAINLLPAAGYRVFPAHSAVLAKVQPTQTVPAQNNPAFLFEPGANGYTLRNLEIMPSLFGSGVLISIGVNDAPQTEYAHIPYNITLDRLLIRGHPVSGQLRGINCSGDNVLIDGCYVSGIKGFAQDTQAVVVSNCRGPVSVLNSYLEAAAENFITHGDDPWIRTSATVSASPAPTTTAARLSTVKDLAVGQHIAMHYTSSGTLRREFANVLTINTVTKDITFTAVTQAPDVPGNVMWGVQVSDITFRRNHVTKDTTWMNPILSAPIAAVPIVTPAGTGLAAGTYYVRIQGKQDLIGYKQNTYASDGSNERQVVIGATSTLTTTWTEPPNTTRYRVYRYQKNGGGGIINGKYFETTNLVFVDNGTGGTDFGALTATSYWQEKNLFELKCGCRVQVDSNVFEYQWISAAADGYACWLKNNNQSGNQPFAQCEDITIEKNIWRHICGWMSVSDKRASGELPQDLPDNMRNVVLRNNLIYDSNTAWRVQSELSSYGVTNTGGAKNVTWDHNTIIHTDGSGAFQLNTTLLEQGYQLTEIWRNNIMIHLLYGVWAPAGLGKPGIDDITNNTGLFNKNVMADGNGAYTGFPAQTNYIPSLGVLETEFKNYAANDFRLKRLAEGDAADSTYLNLGTDGKDIGCDVAAVLLATTGVIESVPEVVPVSPTGIFRRRRGRSGSR